jgi:hypothetical protein
MRNSLGNERWTALHEVSTAGGMMEDDTKEKIKEGIGLFIMVLLLYLFFCVALTY